MTSSLSIATTRDPKSWLHLPREDKKLYEDHPRSAPSSPKSSNKTKPYLQCMGTVPNNKVLSCLSFPPTLKRSCRDERRIVLPPIHEPEKQNAS